MEILVCVRRVPDTSENEIALDGNGDIDRDELVYSVNEADNYAVEEALQIRDRVGGTVTVVTVGGEDDDEEEILRRELAMGVNNAVLISDSAFSGSDGRGIATILKEFVQNKGQYDLILTGVQADDGAAQVGGMLAAMLDYPFASLVNSITVEEGKLKVSREIEGGNREISEIDLPCVLSIQTGINEPRYVGMRGIRQVASVPIPTFGAADLGLDQNAVGEAAAKVKRVDYFVPALSKGAEMLHGKREEIADRVLALVAAKGGIR